MASRHLFVASIDFGTTYSGWSYIARYQFATDPTKGYTHQWYSGSGNLATEKTPTTVLVKPDGKTLEAFGYEAENKYRELIEDEEAEGFYYFRRFKMMLMKTFGEKITLEAELEDEMGRRLPAITVFTLAIEYLVQHAYSTMVNGVTGLSFEDIKWVLTVPAIWTDPAKKFMRQAAEKAGIAPVDLAIALEPECASIYCRHVPLAKRLDDTGVDVSTFPVGTKYMIIDAGGGTIDITVHEIEQSGSLKEITAASGGGWGGILVDHAFEEILIDIFGKNVYQTFKRTATEVWLDLWRDFEVKKRTFNGRPVSIVIPISLLQLYQDEHHMSLAERIESSKYSNSLTFLSKHNKLKFESSIWEQLHDYAIMKTIDHVKELFEKEEVKGIKTMLLVGGFSDSILLQKRIKVSFQLDVIIPIDASSVVLRGALIFGINPGCISKRVLQYTYGCDCALPFIEGTHPESKRVVNDSRIICKDCFDKHVEIGQVVKYGESQTSKYYTPTNRNQENMPFPVYYSKLKDPKYTDVGCSFLESFTVPLTDTTGGLERRVYVSLTFSGTELEAEGREDKTGIVTKAKFRLPE